MEDEKEMDINEICKQVDEQIKNIQSQKVQQNNVEYLYKLVDIKKDILEIKKMEEESGMYGEYNEYGRRMRDSRGRYMEDYNDYNNYGRRGVDSRYRGYNAMDNMYQNYEEYNRARESYNENGNYGAEDGMVRSAEGIMSNVTSIVEELKNTNHPEVNKVIKKYTKKMNEM